MAIVYVFPQVQHQKYEPFARRFAQAYLRHPPGVTDHDLYVICNGGGKITKRQEELFEPLAPNYLYHDNSAKDLGAYFLAAQTIPADFLVCLGAPVRPCIAGWLDYFVLATESNGPGIYAPWGFLVPEVHLRTTCFSIQPQLLTAYPTPIGNKNRYFFEHSRGSITKWCLQNGFQAMQVTRAGAFNPKDYHFVEREESLMLDQHTDSLGWKDNDQTDLH